MVSFTQDDYIMCPVGTAPLRQLVGSFAVCLAKGSRCDTARVPVSLGKLCMAPCMDSGVNPCTAFFATCGHAASSNKKLCMTTPQVQAH